MIRMLLELTNKYYFKFMDHVAAVLAQSVEHQKFNPMVAGSIVLYNCAIFFSLKFICYDTSLQVKTHNQNDCSVKNPSEYIGLRQGYDSVVCLWVV